MEKIQAGIGDKVSLFLNYFSTFVGGFVVAFFFNWKMALVVGVMLPLLAFMAGVIAKVTGHAPRLQHALVSVAPPLLCRSLPPSL